MIADTWSVFIPSQLLVMLVGVDGPLDPPSKLRRRQFIFNKFVGLWGCMLITANSAQATRFKYSNSPEVFSDPLSS